MRHESSERLAGPRARTGRLLATGLLILVAGCAGEGGVPLHPASGRVLVDGQPAEGVQVRLRPADRPDDLDALRPFAETAEDGTFELGTHEKGDGVPVGPYKATLYWPDRLPGLPGVKDRLGGKYDEAAESPFSVTIGAGENLLEPFLAESAKAPAQPSSPGASPDDIYGLGETPSP
jgi:hypothetical protein